MYATLRKNLSLMILPFLPLIAAVMVLPRVGTLSPAVRELLPYAPFAAAGTAILLSLRFHRGRVFLAACLVAASYRGYGAFLQDGISGLRDGVAYLALVAAVPFNIFLFSLMSEKGAGSNGGIMRGIFLLLQLSLLEWAVRFEKTWMTDLLFRPLFPSIPPEALPLPQLPLAAACFYLLVMLLRLRRTGCPVVAAFAAVLVSLLAAAARLDDPQAFTIFSSAAACVLVLGLLQDSYNLAFRDELTGLPSRRAMNERMSSLGRRYTVAMVDVDHFKSFNDTYGHDVGDQALKLVARKIQAVGGGGLAYRYGGEEFAVVFPRKGLADSTAQLEALRETIAGYPLRLRGEGRPTDDETGRKRRKTASGDTHNVKITVSIGVAESGGGATPLQVLKSADQALYRAKKKGRNQVSR